MNFDRREDSCFKAISDFYGNRKAKRSNIPYINHIIEGLIVLEYINASDLAKRAYCLHPFFQTDEDLKDLFINNKFDIFKKYQVPVDAIILAMEYRSTANSFLSDKQKEDYRPSPLNDVRDMLIADKIQNFKDFQANIHLYEEKREVLTNYFKSWLDILDINQDKYEELKSLIEGKKKVDFSENPIYYNNYWREMSLRQWYNLDFSSKDADYFSFEDRFFHFKAREKRETIDKKGIKKRLKNQYGSRCYYCRKKFENYTIDHRIPLCRGGDNKLKNLVLCCMTCNNQKGNLTEEEFKIYKGCKNLRTFISHVKPISINL